VRLHPLCVMAIADHYTMEKEQKGKSRSVGLLFGKQDGRVVTILEALDLPGADKKVLDQFEKTDLNNFKSIYPDYEFVGWYATGDKMLPADQETHEHLTKDAESKEADWRSERPLFLLLDPSPSASERELPVQILEQVVHIIEGKRKSVFVHSPFKITSDEAERVTVVHCANVITGDEGKEQSAVVTPYIALKKAVSALQQRLVQLKKFLEDVNNGSVKADQKVLRKIKGLCSRLPTMESAAFKGDFFSEYNDALLITYLAEITQTQTLLNELMDKYNLVVSAKSGLGRGPRGGGGGSLAAMQAAMMGGFF